MSCTPPDSAEENKFLRKLNTELVQKAQLWKMLAAQRQNEKLDLMMELNEMRLKLAKLRSNGNAQALKLDADLQSASEKALAHLVTASVEIGRTIELAKIYMRERKEMEAVSPRWNAISGTPNTEKVHRVPPMMVGGQFIQPFVSLSRTLLNTSSSTSGERNDLEASPQISDDAFNASRRLDAVAEDMEPEELADTPPRNISGDNSLKGPSWLDAPSSSNKNVSQSRRNFEPFSTTEVEDLTTPVKYEQTESMSTMCGELSIRREFSPTVRCRKCTTSPARTPTTPTPRRASHCSPRPAHNRKISNSGRVLKVMVAKMRLEYASPTPKRASMAALDYNDALSPNGPTVPAAIFSETSQSEMDAGVMGEPAAARRRRTGARVAGGARRVEAPAQDESARERASRPRRQDISSRRNINESSNSGSGGDTLGEGRSRRTRNKVVSYQEKPLNRKMRR